MLRDRLLLLLAVTALVAPSANAQLAGCPAQNDFQKGWAAGTTIIYDVQFLPGSVIGAAVRSGIESWNNHNPLGITFKQKSDFNTASWVIQPGSTATVGGVAGQAAFTSYTGRTADNVLTNATTAIDVGNVGGTTNFDPNISGYLDAFVKVGLHEAGHTLGLKDEPVSQTNTSCGGQTAGISAMNGLCGTNDSFGNIPLSPQQCDTQSILSNPQLVPPGGGGGGGLCDDPNNPCQLCDPGSPDAGGCGSPILIDTTGEGFHLTSAQNGVQFDFFDNGKPIQMAWTAHDSTNAFLVLDRNGNGRIDNATEMFGNLTAQPQSPNPNGFLALAEFDKPENGGNDDGVIDERDAIFSSLRLWKDLNHDGVSQPEELFTLPSLGIYSISLDYRESRRRDEYGNLFRYRAKVNQKTKGDVSESGPWAYDVFFITESGTAKLVEPAFPASMFRKPLISELPKVPSNSKALILSGGTQ